MRNTDLTDIILDDLDLEKKGEFNFHLFIIIISLVFFILVFSLYFKKDVGDMNLSKSDFIKEDIPILTQNNIVQNNTLKENKIEKILEPYYIQVSAYKNERKLPKTYLSNIKSKGFNVKILEDGKFNKVLIGPYNGYDKATENLSNVQDKITKGAFVKKYY